MKGCDVAEQVAANVFQIKVPIPITLGHVNAYLLCEPTADGGIEYSLVDTGMNTTPALEALVAELHALGVAPTDLHRIIITHYHPDHIGLLGRLAALTGKIEIVLHAADAEHMLTLYGDPSARNRILEEWARQNGAPDDESSDMSFASLDVREFVNLNEAIRRFDADMPLRPEDPDGWRVLHTPGHTPGHIVLYHPAQRLLISGDHLLARISSNVGKYPNSRPDPLGDYMASLRKLEPLAVDMVLPAHGPLFPNHRERITELLDHHLARLDRMVEELRAAAAPLTAYDLSHLIWPRRLDPFNRRLALMECLSHLERLRHENRVIEHSPTADGTLRWSAR